MMFNLSKQEKFIIVFLLAMALLGLGIKSIRSTKNEIRLQAVSSDYLTWEEKNIDWILKKARMVNINRAPAEEIINLPGVGPVLAGRIIEYRQSHGFFQNPEELMEVPGIGPGKFKKMREFIIVE